MAFVFMGYLLDKGGVLDRLIDLLNSLIGGVKGGPRVGLNGGAQQAWAG